jgi:uncharacterized membrane protein YccF (DUF307 family)
LSVRDDSARARCRLGSLDAAHPRAKGGGCLEDHVIWVLLFGLWLAIGHLVSAAAMAITIIGIPLAPANLKMIPMSLMPLGKDIVAIVSTPARGRA